jgi:hypothetical protein
MNSGINTRGEKAKEINSAWLMQNEYMYRESIVSFIEGKGMTA